MERLLRFMLINPNQSKNKMKKLKLSIKERAMLVDLMPAQGNKLQQTIVRGLAGKAEFSIQEIEKYKINYSAQGMSWSLEAKDAEFEIEISEAELMILKEASSAVDKEGKVTQHNLSLIDKIDKL